MSAPEAKPSDPGTLEEPTQPLDQPNAAKTTKDENPSADSILSENAVAEEGGGEEEEGECGFCLFMKGGGCKESFVAWEKCIEEAEEKSEDIVEKCFEITAKLKTCMEVHANYYEPVLCAEKAAEAEAVRELEKEAAEAEGIRELEKEAAEAEAKKDSEPKEEQVA